MGYVTCGVKDLNHDLMLVVARVALQGCSDVKRKLIVPAQISSSVTSLVQFIRFRKVQGGLQGGTRVALQGCSDVKRTFIIPAQSAAGLQAWYRITRARGLPGVTRGYKGYKGYKV